MDIVLFCGGRGTRLSEFTKDAPKPLVEVGEYPIIWHILKIFEHYGHKRFILTLGYRGDMLKQWFLHYRYSRSFEIDYANYNEPKSICDWKILLKDTGLDCGTGFRLKQIESDIKTERFIITYGDGLADININSLLDFHNNMRAKKDVIATMSVFRPYSKFGIIECNKDSLVDGFKEKPQIKEWVNMGFIVCEKKIFDFIGNEPSCMLETDVLPKIAKLGKLAVYQHQGFFEPMDSFKDYTYLNQMWSDNKAKWKIWKE